jgi:hypothetical protein
VAENKYNRITCKIDGSEVDLSRRVFIPVERDGRFRTHDGQEYIRGLKGCIRRAPSSASRAK